MLEGPRWNSQEHHMLKSQNRTSLQLKTMTRDQLRPLEQATLAYRAGVQGPGPLVGKTKGPHPCISEVPFSPDGFNGFCEFCLHSGS